MTRVQRVAMTLLPLAAAACGNSKTETQVDVCDLVGAHVRERLAASEPDRARLHAGLETRSLSTAYVVALEDLRATHSAAFRIGSMCLSPRISAECLTGPAPLHPGDIDELFTRATRLADGFAGRGPCTNEKRPAASELCRRMGQQLTLAASTSEIPEVLAAWAGDDASSDLTLLQRHAQGRVSEWRAFLDYARELVPACVPSSSREGCFEVAKHTSTAPPSEVLEGLTRLGRAFEQGKGCNP